MFIRPGMLNIGMRGYHLSVDIVVLAQALIQLIPLKLYLFFKKRFKDNSANTGIFSLLKLIQIS